VFLGGRRVVLVAALAAGLLAFPSASVRGAEPFDDNQVPILNMAGAGDLHLYADDSLEPEVVDPPSVLGVDDQFCASADTGACVNRPDLRFVAHLPSCDATVKVDCIVSVTATSAAGVESAGAFSRYFPDKSATSYTGKPSIGLPTGRAPSVWTIAGAPHAAGNEYAVVARLRGGVRSRPGAEFQIALTAVSVKTDADTTSDYKMPYWVRPGQMAGPASDRGKFRCAYWGENGACLLSRPFPADTRFSVTVRLASEPAGWLHGRIGDPSITFTKNSDSVDVTVSAAPVQVPATRVARNYAQFPANIQSAFSVDSKFGAGGSRQPGGQYLTDPAKRNAEYSFLSYKEEGFEQLSLVTSLIEDKASYAPWLWRVRTLSSGEMSKAGTCLTSGSGGKGIVTTNATVYGRGPPALSADGTTLDYKIAAPHYTRTGEVFKGEYNLAMRADVADCLYGLSKKSATSGSGYVEEAAYVDQTWTDDGGLESGAAADDYIDEEPTEEEELTVDELLVEETASSIENPTDVISTSRATLTDQLATGPNTSVRDVDGWVYFSATGLTFSGPQVKVRVSEIPVQKLLCLKDGKIIRFTVRIQRCPAGTIRLKLQHCSRKGVAKVAVGTSPRCPKGFAKATAITCVKGSLARKAIGTAPTCPRGWTKGVTIHCVKGKAARIITSVRATCSNGFVRATSVTCRRGSTTRVVLAPKPTCPAGFKRTP